MYTPEIDNNRISTPLLTMIGISFCRMPYGIQMEEEMMLRPQKVSE
jgi:hypothetical protein